MFVCEPEMFTVCYRDKRGKLHGTVVQTLTEALVEKNRIIASDGPEEEDVRIARFRGEWI